MHCVNKVNGTPVWLESKELSWEDIQKNEGIYEPTRSSSCRIVVIKHDGYKNYVVLCVNYNQTRPALAENWDKHAFYKTNEKMSITIE